MCLCKEGGRTLKREKKIERKKKKDGEREGAIEEVLEMGGANKDKNSAGLSQLQPQNEKLELARIEG